MNETLTKILTALRSWWEKQSPGTKTGIFAVGGFAVLAALAVSLVQARDPYQVLYSDLQPEEARAVAKKLGEEKIHHTLSSDNSAVSVPTSQVAKARMELAKAGLPGNSVVGFEKFDSATLGMSSYVQRIQYVRAVQGELTRSIQQLASVKRARVHISIPPKKTFLEEEEPPKASVILELKRGQHPSKSEVNGIAHLVASAVEGLKVMNVSIVDTLGNFLHRPEADNGAAGLSTALLESQRAMEAEYEKRVEEILTPVVGLGKVRAKVAAEVDPSRVNTTEESFDAEKAAVRNIVKNDEVIQGSKPNPGGIAGSRSNLPGAETPAPPLPMANSSTEKNVSNISYSIPRKIQVTDKPSGGLKRLTVAVIVDGYYQTVDGKEQFTPRSDEELKRIQQLVGNSVGFDEQRRDSITVSCLPFRPTELTPEEAPVTEVGWWKSQPTFFKVGIIFLAAMVPLFLGLLLVLRRKPRKKAIETTVNEFPKTVAQIQAEVSGAAVLSAPGAGAVTNPAEAALAGETAAAHGELESPEKQEEIDLRKKIVERLAITPKKGLAVVEDWLEEPMVESENKAAASRPLLRAIPGLG